MTTLTRRIARSGAAAAAALALAVPTGASAADQPVLDSLIDAVVAQGATGVTARVTNGTTSWEGSAGVRDVTTGQAVPVNAEFRAASNTKMIVSVLVLQEVAAGRWSLDGTRVRDVVPAALPAGAPNPTLRQLLSHRTGAPDYLAVYLASIGGVDDFLHIISAPYNDHQLVRAITGVPWIPLAGRAGSYSNTNFVLLGMMLRQATGQQLNALATQRVFTPAGMKATRLESSTWLRPTALQEYAVFGGGPVPLSTFNPRFFSAAGSMVTTPRDLNAFHLALSSGKLLPWRLLAQMRSVEAVLPGYLEYGLGTYRLPDICSDGYLWGHDGASFGTLSVSMSSPDGSRRITAAMSGRNYDGVVNYAFASFVTEASAQACPTAATAARKSALNKAVLDQLATQDALRPSTQSK